LTAKRGRVFAPDDRAVYVRAGSVVYLLAESTTVVTVLLMARKKRNAYSGLTT
jgi:hypothetical protein